MTAMQMLRTFTAATFLTLVALPASAADPSGTVKITGTAIAAGIGYSWGDGVLTMKDGTVRNFRIKGISVVDVGITELDFDGEVYGLDKLDKFPGSYTAGEAGVALIAGGSGVSMKNGAGVVMEISSSQEGIRVTLAAEGLDVEWK